MSIVWGHLLTALRRLRATFFGFNGAWGFGGVFSIRLRTSSSRFSESDFGMTDDLDPEKFLEAMNAADDEMALALGHFVRDFADMERMLTWSLTQLIPIQMNEAQIIFSNMINMRDRLAVVKSLARNRFKVEAEYLEIAQILGSIKAVNAERNLLLHNEWGAYFLADNSHSKTRYEAKRRLTVDTYTRTAEQVREQAKKAILAAEGLNNFFHQRPLSAPPPSPAKP